MHRLTHTAFRWLTTAALVAALAPPLHAQPTSAYSVTYEGESGPGLGTHIVFLSGDHEYRSEEILPAWARLMARHFGFKTTVFFTLDEDGFVEPGSSNVKGLEVLSDADLMVVALRFQDFPDEEMAHFVDYVERGGPVIGLRTATHAFQIADGPYRKYTWNYDGPEYEKGFGRQVLGETWAGHYGRNHRQSSLVIPMPARRDHPVLTGLGPMHVQSGGYEAYPLEPFTPLAVGIVLNGMGRTDPPDETKEALPVAWVRHYEGANGETGRVFTTTHGASEDFQDADFRRMLVNAAFWALGMESEIDASMDVSLVGPYHPTLFSFDGYRRGVRPSDMAGWDTPIMDRSKPTTPPGGNRR